MPKISGFADEIGQNPEDQMDAFGANNVKWIELRGANGLNVLKFPPDMVKDLKKRFDDRGFGVACIGSPIGKIRLDQDLEQHFADFKHAVDLAEQFGTKYIRIFSFYAPEGKDAKDYREQVIDQIGRQLDHIKGRPVTLVLENESNLFGAYPERCIYLFNALPSDQLVSAFDPANFVHMGVENVYKTCWLPLRKYVGYFHIKDWVYGQKDKAVPAGEGNGHVPEILKDAAATGYDGFLALEPHLGKAEHSTGVTGPDLFKVAVDALRKICRNVGWTDA
jgi:sugar phosphate isomerase/epimerase